MQVDQNHSHYGVKSGNKSILINNSILENSHSSYVNPLTMIQRKHKPVRICVNARQVNKQMVRDRAKTALAHELLQRFQGAKHISSIDLNNAFLQIPLEESSRVWAAFTFDGQNVPIHEGSFWFRNSLATFISLFSDRILQDMYSVTWIISLCIQITLKNMSNTWMTCLGN